jgi:hypothetical protein
MPKKAKTRGWASVIAVIPAYVTGVTGDSANMRDKGHAEGPPERAGSSSLPRTSTNLLPT